MDFLSYIAPGYIVIVVGIALVCWLIPDPPDEPPTKR